MVHEVGGDNSFKRAQPEVMDEEHGEIQSPHIIGEEIHHLADCGDSQRVLAHPQRFPVDQTAHGQSDTHSEMHRAQHERVRSEDVQGTYSNHSSGPDIGGLDFTAVRVRIVIDESTQEGRL